ncbi:MAG: L,D-transpeptidase [Anaerolineaceae bacterium]|nr:L,D-transpeptidase [Anaerolineaceae bacterium]
MKSEKRISRREFLKIGLVGLAGLAFAPFTNDGDEYLDNDLARVATTSVSVYSRPSDTSRIVHQRFRDEILHVYEDVISEDGPGYNPLWHRVWGGYVHSAHIQKVKVKFNQVLSSISEKGQLVEVTVPYSQSKLYNEKRGSWTDNYRLYFQSNHWVTGVREGPDGSKWYVISDDLTGDEYLAPAKHFRPIMPDELQPISPDVPLADKYIEVSIARQEFKAYEYGSLVKTARISSGVLRKVEDGLIPTATPKGTFNITSKMPSKHMGSGILTDDPEEYVIPGVPWVSFFEPVTGVAFHGTFWHNNYGSPMSHGCVNMTYEDSKWVYLWSMPEPTQTEWLHKGFGTRVVVY